MTGSAKVLGIALVVAASGCTGTSDPCSGATSGTACLWAGDGVRGYNKATPNANRLDSQLDFPTDLTFGPDGRAYIADYNNHMIRRVEKNGSLDIVVGTDYEGDGPPEMQDRLPTCNPPGALGTTVALNHPTDVKFGPDGMLYVAAWHNNKIRVLDPDSDMVYVLAGNGYGFQGDGGPACQALFNQPKTMVWDPAGNMYIDDQRNVRIREVTPGAGSPPYSSSQVINTIAGNGTLGNIGDGGPALAAEFGWETSDTPQPSGALVLTGGYIYLADSLNNRIRRVNLGAPGMPVDCIAGVSAQAGYSGDGGAALQAEFNFPVDLELGPDGRLYVADRQNNVVRAIDLTSGVVTTVVGNGNACDVTMTTCPNRAKATDMELNQPQGIAFDPEGNLYVADTFNHRILKVIR